MTLEEEILILKEKVSENLPVLERIDVLNRLAWLLRGRDWRKVKGIVDEAYRLSNEQHYLKGIGYSTMMQSFLLYYFDSDTTKAFEGFEKSKQIFEQIDEIRGIAQNLSFQALVFWGLGEYDKGFQSVNQALKLHTQTNNIEGEAWSTYLLGTFYLDLKDNENALKYHQKALSIFEKLKDVSGQCASMIGIGGIYHALKNYDMALVFHQKGLEKARPHGLTNFEARSLNELGMVYHSLQENQKAVLFLETSLQIREEIGNKQGIVTTTSNLGEVFYQQNDLEKALLYLQKAEQVATEINAKAKLIRIHKLQADLYKKTAKAWEALDQFEKYMEVKSAVMGEENSTQLKNMQSMFQLEKAQKEAEIEKIRNTELRVAYEQIELQTKNIIDSIKYAKRIQESILLPTFFVESHFKDAFIFYLPKDIVSGDFYWFSAKNDAIVLAANDCTGHGVPGAFMVVLVNGLLNQLVNEKNITNPAQILTELDTKIKEALRQDESGSSKDGMDTAILEVRTKEQKIRFAGAKNPLYRVRNQEMFVVKGAKFSVGGSQYENRREKIFEVFEAQMQANDIFYIFSDGFADQFNPNGQKYMSRRFRDFLLKISQKEMYQQKEALINELADWKQSQKQTDDILVIGLQV